MIYEYYFVSLFMEKIDLRKAKKQEKEAIRIRAIIMHKQKIKQKEIAIFLGVHKNSVCQWVKLYKSKGALGLKEVKRGRKKGSGSLLSPEQELGIQKLIIGKMPDQLKLHYALWTRKAIKDLIKKNLQYKHCHKNYGRLS